MSFQLDGLHGNRPIETLYGSSEVKSPKESWLEKMAEMLDSKIAIPRWRECWELVLQGVDLVNWSWDEDCDTYTLELDQCYKFTYRNDPILYMPKKVTISLDPSGQTLSFVDNHHANPTGFCGVKEIGFWRCKKTVLGAAQTTRYDEEADIFETETLTNAWGFEYSRHKSYDDTLATWREGVKEGIGDELPEHLFPRLEG